MTKNKNQKVKAPMSPYKCPDCGNDRSFIEQKGEQRFGIRFYGQNKKGVFECMPDTGYPENFEPDYILCARCETQVG